MLNGIFRRKLKTMTVTASIAAAMSYVMMLSDNILVGQLINEQAVGGVNLVTPFKSFVVFIATLISGGITSCMITEIAQFNKDETERYFINGVAVSIAAGIILCLSSFVVDDAYFGSAFTQSESYIYAKRYFSFFSLVMLVYPLFSLLHSVIYIRGKVKLYILVYAVQFVGNIFFSIIFVKHFGVGGISLGSAMATLVCIILLLVSLSRDGEKLELDFNPEKHIIKGIVENGITSASPLLFTAIFTFVLNRFFVASFGEEPLPVLAVASNVQKTITVFGGIGLAATPLVALYDTEFNTKQLRSIISYSLRVTVAMCLIIAALVIAFARPIIGLFGVTKPELVEMALIPTRLIPLGFLASAYCLLIFTYHSCVGPLIYSGYSAALHYLVLPMAVILPLGAVFGTTAMWIGFAVAPMLAAFFTVLPVHLKFGLAASPFMLYRDDPPRVYSFEVEELDQNSIVGLSQRVDGLLRTEKVSAVTRNRISLLIEEIFMLALEKNPGETLSAECTVRLGDDDIQLVLKDSGILFDVTDEDMQLFSFRAFLVSRVMAYQNKKVNMAVLCCNRNAFRFPRDAAD